jgi:hypothetical protein
MAANAAFAAADVAAAEVGVDDTLAWDDLVKSVLIVGVDAALTLASAPSRAASERESVGIAAAGVAGVAAADTGVDDGLVSGDTASLSVSLLLPTPPQGLHETNFPSADGARAKPGPSSLSLPLPLPPTGPETTLPPL